MSLKFAWSVGAGIAVGTFFAVMVWLQVRGNTADIQDLKQTAKTVPVISQQVTDMKSEVDAIYSAVIPVSKPLIYSYKPSSST